MCLIHFSTSFAGISKPGSEAFVSFLYSLLWETMDVSPKTWPLSTSVEFIVVVQSSALWCKVVYSTCEFFYMRGTENVTGWRNGCFMYQGECVLVFKCICCNFFSYAGKLVLNNFTSKKHLSFIGAFGINRGIHCSWNWASVSWHKVSRIKGYTFVDFLSIYNLQATCEVAAQKQMHQLLFPRSRRKKFRSHEDELGDSKS